jgi:hypothetical protein
MLIFLSNLNDLLFSNSTGAASNLETFSPKKKSLWIDHYYDNTFSALDIFYPNYLKTQIKDALTVN